jgi:hypothetical protein
LWHFFSKRNFHQVYTTFQVREQSSRCGHRRAPLLFSRLNSEESGPVDAISALPSPRGPVTSSCRPSPRPAGVGEFSRAFANTAVALCYCFKSVSIINLRNAERPPITKPEARRTDGRPPTATATSPWAFEASQTLFCVFIEPGALLNSEMSGACPERLLLLPGVVRVSLTEALRGAARVRFTAARNAGVAALCLAVSANFRGGTPCGFFSTKRRLPPLRSAPISSSALRLRECHASGANPPKMFPRVSRISVTVFAWPSHRP